MEVRLPSKMLINSFAGHQEYQLNRPFPAYSEALLSFLLGSRAVIKTYN